MGYSTLWLAGSTLAFLLLTHTQCEGGEYPKRWEIVLCSSTDVVWTKGLLDICFSPLFFPAQCNGWVWAWECFLFHADKVSCSPGWPWSPPVPSHLCLPGLGLQVYATRVQFSSFTHTIKLILPMSGAAFEYNRTWVCFMMTRLSLEVPWTLLRPFGVPLLKLLPPQNISSLLCGHTLFINHPSFHT